jgi:flagellar motor protein MotB
MRLVWLSVVFFVLSNDTIGQMPKAPLEQADKLFARGEVDKALKIYQELYSKSPNDPKIQFRVGISHLSTNTKFQALPYLEKAFESDPAVDADIHYYLGMAHQLHSHFNSAVRHFNEYKKKNKRLTTIANHKIRECELGDSLMRNPVLCIIKVLEWPVNSPYQDYGSVLNREETELYFTSARDTTKTDLRFRNTYFEDILKAEKEGGSWSVPAKISSNVNDEYHDAVTYLSPDGKTMLLYYERGNGDIYQTLFDGVEWSIPAPLEGEINSNSWETSGCVSPDGRKLFFASDRPGGYGDLDIYSCTKLDNGKWSKPLNLGPGVNTKGSEDAPFIHSDGTLFFGSDGHPGLGSTDIFKSELKEGKWQKAVNLGYPINTPESDSFFFLSEDKKRGYFSSVRNEGIGYSDICEVTFLDPPPPIELVEPEPEVVQEPEDAEAIEDEFMDSMISLQRDLGIATELVGKVIDDESTKPLRAEIVLVDNKLNKVLARVYSNSETGDFKIVIPHGGNYGINTSVDGYLFNSLNFEVPTFSEPQELETHILMVRAKVGSRVVMKNIFFDTGKSDIREESIAEIERILDLLQRNTLIKLQVNGHTDNI